jgi:hypothetical protein
MRIFSIYLVILGLTLVLQVQAQERGVVVEGGATNPALQQVASQMNEQWALLIAINNYIKPEYPDLENCINDAESVAKLFQEDYGFSKVTKLYDQDATRSNILRELERLVDTLTERQDLVLFFSGHGKYPGCLLDPFRCSGNRRFPGKFATPDLCQVDEGKAYTGYL